MLTSPQGPDQGQEKTTCFPGLRQGVGRVRPWPRPLPLFSTYRQNYNSSKRPMSTSVLRVPSVPPPGRSSLCGFCLAQDTEYKGASQGAASELLPAQHGCLASVCSIEEVRRPSSHGGPQPCPETVSTGPPGRGYTQPETGTTPTLSSLPAAPAPSRTHGSHIILSTKHSHGRWCPSPSQVLPPFHRKMGGWPGRCPSGRFPGALCAEATPTPVSCGGPHSAPQFRAYRPPHGTATVFLGPWEEKSKVLGQVSWGTQGGFPETVRALEFGVLWSRSIRSEVEENSRCVQDPITRAQNTPQVLS